MESALPHTLAQRQGIGPSAGMGTVPLRGCRHPVCRGRETHRGPWREVPQVLRAAGGSGGPKSGRKTRPPPVLEQPVADRDPALEPVVLRRLQRGGEEPTARAQPLAGQAPLAAALHHVEEGAVQQIAGRKQFGEPVATTPAVVLQALEEALWDTRREAKSTERAKRRRAETPEANRKRLATASVHPLPMHPRGLDPAAAYVSFDSSLLHGWLAICAEIRSQVRYTRGPGNSAAKRCLC